MHKCKVCGMIAHIYSGRLNDYFCADHYLAAKLPTPFKAEGMQFRVLTSD